MYIIVDEMQPESITQEIYLLGVILLRYIIKYLPKLIGHRLMLLEIQCFFDDVNIKNS